MRCYLVDQADDPCDAAGRQKSQLFGAGATDLSPQCHDAVVGIHVNKVGTLDLPVFEEARHAAFEVSIVICLVRNRRLNHEAALTEVKRKEPG
jgi:hypothetical protein